jgi:cardiolipin synthase
LFNVANTITLLRFALVPALALQLIRAEYGTAFVLFIISAVSDLADGIVARRWNQTTRFGAVADPLADKLTMLTVTGLLTLQHVLPWWFALAVVLRDGLIVGGALAYHFWIGPVEMAPSRISKLNTAMEFLLLLAVLAIQAGYLPDGLWWQLLLFATLATIAWSGGNYVLVWGQKAAQVRRRMT